MAAIDTCPPLAVLFADTSKLRETAAIFEDALGPASAPAGHPVRLFYQRTAAALRLAALVIESGEAEAGGHLAALAKETNGTVL